jgi:hypothetical protein
MADKALELYKGQNAEAVDQTWVSLFTTNPTVDHATSHGAVEWGPARIRVHPDSGSGSPSWSAIFDYSTEKRAFDNVGSIIWSSISLTVSPSTIVGIGVFGAETGGDLLTWQPIPADEQFSREDGGSVVLKPGAVTITAE